MTGTSRAADDRPDAAPPLPGGRSQPLWRKVVGYALAAVILVCLAWYLARQWKDLPEEGLVLRWDLFALSSALVAVFFVAQGYGWGLIADGLGPRLPTAIALKYWFFSQVAKYVPGKVMLPIVRARSCMRRGHTVEGVLLSIFLEVAFMTIGALLLALASTSAYLARLSGSLIWLYIFLVPAGLVGIHPRVLGPLVNFALRRVRRRPVEIRLRYRTMVALLALFTTGWLMYGLAALLLCMAMTESVSLRHFLPITGTFAFAWVVGFLTFISPGGLGAREGALVLLLAATVPAMPHAVAALVALVSRLQWTGLEALASAALLAVRDRKPD